MTHDHSTVAVFDTHASAEAAIRRLSGAGFPIERLSIIGKGYETEEHVVGFFNLGTGSSCGVRMGRSGVGGGGC